MTPMIASAPDTIETEPCIVLGAINWRQYETIAGALAERAGLRMIYRDGSLTLLSPSYRHDWVVKALGRIVVAVADGLEIEWTGAGHTTYRREDQGAGVEGDDVYYFGPNAEQMVGARAVDLTVQPPPDLAIEVEVTHPADDAVAIWGRLGVPEVWRLDVKRWSLSFGLRSDDGAYAPSPRSAALPVLEPADVLDQLRRAEQLVMSRWSRQLDGWVRDVLVPRRGD